MALLTPEALDAFLVEKLGARRALVELDLEPSGLVIKHDDDGEVARVEPAVVAEKVRQGRERGYVALQAVERAKQQPERASWKKNI